jgi:hypothetical protein
VLRYRRDTSNQPDAIDATAAHVRDHLAAVADLDDDPTTYTDQVQLTVGPHVDGDPDLVTIFGELDADPAAPYLRDDFDPEHDVATNPLSVPSIQDSA